MSGISPATRKTFHPCEITGHLIFFRENFKTNPKNKQIAIFQRFLWYFFMSCLAIFPWHSGVSGNPWNVFPQPKCWKISGNSLVQFSHLWSWFYKNIRDFPDILDLDWREQNRDQEKTPNKLLFLAKISGILNFCFNQIKKYMIVSKAIRTWK